MSDTETARTPVDPLVKHPRVGEGPLVRRVFRMTVMRRIIHWATVLSILAAAVTGLYIAAPYYSAGSGFVMAWNRTIHFTAAIVMDVCVIVLAYLYFFSRVDPTARTELSPTRSNLVRWQEAFLNLFTFNRRRRFDSRRPDPFNATLFVILHLFVVFQLFTGLQLYVHGLSNDTSAVGAWWPWSIHFFTDWTGTVFGGPAGVRWWHHFMTYPVLGWAILHVYYEVWRTVMWKEGDIAIMFGGYKYGADEVHEHAHEHAE